MKKIISIILIFSLLFIFLTFLNNELEVIKSKVIKINKTNAKLEQELNLLKSEWEFVNSPHNISFLSENYLKFESSELISINDFIKIISRPLRKPHAVSR